MPEFDDLSIAGLGATVLEVRGRGERQKVILKWSEDSLAAMPDDYVAQCRERQLAAEMVCLPASAVLLDK